MKIGLDIDNVILDTDTVLLEEFLKEDKNKRNKGIINKDLYLMSGMFDWSKDEINEFLNKNMEEIAKNLKNKDNSKYYMDKLLEEGHELYLISNRSSKQYKNAYDTTKNNLKENNINYTKLIITETNDKSQACLDNEIDIMIDDRPSNCFKLVDKNIRCILFKSEKENREFTEFPVIKNWEELYILIKKMTNC